MELTINGTATEINEELSITQLLVQQNVKRPEMVSVELNGEIIKRETFPSIILKAGDKVEFLYFMGGGVCS